MCAGKQAARQLHARQAAPMLSWISPWQRLRSVRGRRLRRARLCCGLRHWCTDRSDGVATDSHPELSLDDLREPSRVAGQEAQRRLQGDDHGEHRQRSQRRRRWDGRPADSGQPARDGLSREHVPSHGRQPAGHPAHHRAALEPPPPRGRGALERRPHAGSVPSIRTLSMSRPEHTRSGWASAYFTVHQGRTRRPRHHPIGLEE
mmetsp:Transcript_94224/g.275576  ORF Transcript_94224/g.275576 Transcript_94224/m.275576 type:complete len:204 (-) Transcript_94224:67-678(-)